jgi:hypothetical protein
MKLTVAAITVALAIGGLSSLAHAQVQVQVPGVGVRIGEPAPPPREFGSSVPPRHCEELAQREEGLRHRMSYMHPGDERARLEGELRVVHEERERCGRH